MPDGAVAGVTAPGGWKLRADVPGGIFSLAVEADDETAFTALIACRMRVVATALE
jgi:hypothetical protein